MIRKVIFFTMLFILPITSSASIFKVKFYKNDQYVSKLNVYVFSSKRYYNASEISRLLGGKNYWYSVSKKMLIQLKSHTISIQKDSDLVKYDNEYSQEISNPMLVRGGKFFLSEEIFLHPSFSKTLGFRLEYSNEDSLLKLYEKINISSIRYFSYKDKTRVVIYLYDSLEYSVSRQTGGKLVLSIIGGSYPVAQETIEIKDGVLNSISVFQEGKSVKVNFDLTENYSDSSVFTLESPHRIVLDLKAEEKKIENRIGDPLPTIIPEVPVSSASASTAVAVLPDSIEIKNRSKKIIIIDPGHGGKDPGGKRCFGMKEKDINLSIAKELYKLLSLNQYFEPIITRDNDVFIPLNERSRIANDKNADIFISIHANASRHSKEKGFEIYFLSEKASDPWSAEVADYENSVIALEDDSKVYDSAALILHSLARNEYINEGSLLASYVSKAMEKKTPFQNRGIKQAAFYVLRGSYCPGILVETGFMTNPTDQKNMNNPKVRKKVAQAIYEGLKEYARKKEWIK